MYGLASQILRIARMVTALNDVDFNRFKSIFDKVLNEESVDVEAVRKCTGRAYAEACVKTQSSVDSFGLTESEKADIAREAEKTWASDVRPVLAKIEDFLRGRTWNIMEANAIWMAVDGYEAKSETSFVLGLKGGVMLAVDDYLKAFKKAAEAYLTSSAEAIDNSGFESALEHLKSVVEESPLREDCSNFEMRIRGGIESLKAAQAAEAKGDMRGVFREMASFDANLDSMRAVGQNFGGLFNVFFNYFIGRRTDNGELYDLDRWRQMQKEFRKRFGIIPSALNGMVYAIDKFLTAHGKDNVISGTGRDAKALYRDDATRCYDSLQSNYVNIIRALGNSGVEFDLDAEMSELKGAIDAM